MYKNSKHGFMRKSGMLLTGLLLIGICSQAQTIYLRGGLGAAITTAAQINADYTSPNLTSKKAGYGSGLPFILAAGYQFNHNLGFELGIDYFYGFKYKTATSILTYDVEAKSHGQMLSLVLAFVVTLPFEKFRPYARLGLKIGVLNSVTDELHQVDNGAKAATSRVIDATRKDYGGVALGLQAALGSDFALNKKISLFAEIQVDGISYSPTHGKYTNYNVNGEDQLGNMFVKDKSWDYKKEIDRTKTIPNDQPDELSRVNYAFSNVGLVVGVKFNIVQTESTKPIIEEPKTEVSQSITKKPSTKYEKHYLDFGTGLGLDYGGLMGVKIAYLPIPYFSIFAAGGYYLFGFGWNTGATWHILPSTSQYTVRPNIKLMYGVNGGTTATGTTAYNKMFYGFTPGAGLEMMFGRHKKNGLDFDLNFPIHGDDFKAQLDAMQNDPNLTGVTPPLPIGFSIGYHHEF